ncbi:MAG: RluA family pseudouridine synthase [Bacteroidales bacterium]
MIDFPEPLQEETDLYEHHRVVVDKGQSLLRIDKFLIGRLENVTRNRVQIALRAGNILVNGKNAKPNYKVKPNDIITVVLAQPPREFELIPENIPFNQVYEDDDVIIINKNAGMVVHPGHGNFTGTLVNALLYYFQEKGSKDYPYLVHRIDKDTSGLLIVAKNEFAQSILANAFFKRDVERRYIALVWGDMAEDEGTIEGNIGRSANDRRVMYVYQDGEYGKPAITHYKVIKRFGYVTLIECRLETGRTHQIRAHLRFIGHPLFNDEKYGGDQILKGTTFSKYKQFIQNCFSLISRQALHAKSIGFNHPVTNKYMFFDSPLPDDMASVLEKWERYTDTEREINQV